MSTHKNFDKFCCVILCLTLILTVLFMNADKFGIQKASIVMGYEKKLFDTSKVHSINIVMDNWDNFVANCQSEEYYNCTVVIDNEAYKNVAIRGKGNTSLTQVASYGNNRYSFKIEFDHYDSTKSYYGLDKLCLNNIIQDNTYMKDYLSYTMMSYMGVAAPLCSYAYITVNGEDWGLYLAVEGIEESFLQRNYGKDYGELYKPDSQSMGGGRGNGENFDMDNLTVQSNSADTATGVQANTAPDNQTDNQAESVLNPQNSNGEASNNNFEPWMINGTEPPEKPSGDNNTSVENRTAFSKNSENDEPVQSRAMPNGDEKSSGMMNSSDDVLLKYIDDDADSYSNIFNNAKTDISDSDKTRLIDSLKNLSNNQNIEDTVDIEKVLCYFVVHNFVLNFDSYTGSIIHNYYLYEKDGQMQMIPWDYNLAFGGFKSMGSAESLVNYPIDTPISGGSVEDRPMLAWIFANEEYTELYHQYFSEFISEYFDSGYFEELIDSIKEMISPYVEKDPTKFCTYDEFEKGIDTLKEFCLLRAKSISGQLDGTIGSTSDTQSADTLISTDDIQISDMGSMNNSEKVQKGQENTVSDSTVKSFENNENESSNDESSFQNSNSQPPGGNMPEPPETSAENNNQDSADKSNLQTNNNSDDSENRKPPSEKTIRSQTDSSAQSENKTTTFKHNLVVLSASAAILISAILFAVFFKRRRHQL